MKKATYLLLIHLILNSYLILETSSQTNWKPEEYAGIPENIKRDIFYDDFIDNRNLWDLGENINTWIEKIDNGNLYIESLNYIACQDYLPVPFDEEIDFEIEANIAFISGDKYQACGLQWGKTSEGQKQFDFFFSGSGQFTIDKFTGNEFFDYVPFTESEFVNRTGYNKLTIRKTDNNYYFFLNEQLVHKMPYVSFIGKNIGFQVGKKSAIDIDFIRVSELVNIDEIEPSQLMVMDYNFTSSSEKFEKGIPVTLNLKIKNTGEKLLEKPVIEIELPLFVEVIGKNSYIIDKIERNEEKNISFKFFAKKEYKSDRINVELNLLKVNFTNANDLELSITLNKDLPKADENLLAQEYSAYRGSGDPLKGLNVAKARTEIQIGNYYALIIGIDDYKDDWKKLKNAINDAKSVEYLLRNKYEFHYIKALYNEQATRKNIIHELEWLTDEVKTNDNVFIFFSGHGDYKKDIQKGYWVPVDATSHSVAEYISNSDLQSLIASIKSKHTLLISDACFSGDIFRGKTLMLPYKNDNKYYNKVYSLTSRKAISSGGIEPVLDGGKDGHSVFSYYLLKCLNSNQNRFYDGGQLYNDLKIPVVNNSEQTPEFNPIKNTGDEGGQFIFVRKYQ